ncbi:MAG TPA: hypothetical protein PLK06_01945 [bacterium]|nr:hypothetical protein [bacterium]
MREKDKDEAWIREVIRQAGFDDVVYISQNHYDGGYEVRVGTADVFVDYGAIDAQDLVWINLLRV